MSVDPNPNSKQEEKEAKFKLQKKLTESIFHQHTALMALLDHTFFFFFFPFLFSVFFLNVFDPFGIWIKEELGADLEEYENGVNL